jgi:hypothetical protein
MSAPVDQLFATGWCSADQQMQHVPLRRGTPHSMMTGVVQAVCAATLFACIFWPSCAFEGAVSDPEAVYQG